MEQNKNIETSNLISIELTNNTSSYFEVGLFSGIPNSSDSYTETNYKVDSFVYNNGDSVIVNGVRSNTTGFGETISSTDINDLMTQLNSSAERLVFDCDSVFTYVQLTANTYFINVSNAGGTTFTSMVNDTTSNFYFYSTYEALNSTPIGIVTDNGIDYNELCSEVQNQPYIFDSVAVFANSIDQLTKTFKIVNREPDGHKITELAMPVADPMQTQFVLYGINVEFSPSPTNSLRYTLLGGESVKLWFFYRNIDQVEVDSNTKYEKEFLVYNTNNIMEMAKPASLKNNTMKKNTFYIVSNPMFDLAKPKFDLKKITIKDKVSKHVESKEISNEEVYNAFSGSDFFEEK